MKKSGVIFYSLLLAMIFAGTCYSQTIRLFTGKYNEDDNRKGVNIFDLNRERGTFKLVSESDAGPNPSYFCISKKHGYIYAANEVMSFNGVKGGGVTTLKYNEVTGAAEKIKELVVPKGGPCFIALSPAEDYLLLANYSSSSVAVVKLDGKGIPEKVTDTISYTGAKGQESHPHMISFDPSGKRVYLTDLGFDHIVIYTFNNSTGRLGQLTDGIVPLAKGSGPRHFVFNEKGTKLYVIYELNSTISVFDVDADGRLKMIQTLSTLAENFKGESNCADIHIGNDGKFLYGSNRGENTIVTFRISATGTLTLAGRASCGGNWPRNFVIDPSGKFILVANQKSGNIALFRIDAKTGVPVNTGKECKIGTPSCLKFFPSI
jgi:6-phosphogluconolactonase